MTVKNTLTEVGATGPYTQGDSDVISSYQLFSAILWGKLCEMMVILTSVDVTFSIR